MTVNKAHVLDGIEADASVLFLVPRIYRLLLRTMRTGHLAAGEGLKVRHLLDHADEHEWKKLREQALKALAERHYKIDTEQPIRVHDIRIYAPELAQSCTSNLVKDEFMPRSPDDLRILEVATLALRNDQARGTRQFRNFLHLLANMPEEPPRPAESRPSLQPQNRS